MTDIRRARAALTLFVFSALAATGRVVEAQPIVSHAQFSGWIARHHPQVVSGEARVNAVLIVVDTTGEYVASLADTLARGVTAAIDSVFADVAARHASELLARNGEAKRAERRDSLHLERLARVIESSHRDWLTRLGVQPERVDFGGEQMMHVRAGVVAPVPLYIVVLPLKRS